MGAYYGESAEKYLASCVKPVLKRGCKELPKPIKEKDRKIISDYLAEQPKLKPSTAKMVAVYLVLLCRDLPLPLSDIDTKDVLQYIAKAEIKLKQNTRRRFYPLLRGFLQWMVAEGVNAKLNMDKIIPNLKPPAFDLEGRKPSQMLSGEDVKKLIEGARYSRDRALLATMYEGSLRPVEICSAVWSDINFDKFGCQFSTNKKTGKSRYIRLIMAAPYLLQWKNDHPCPEPDQPVFVSMRSSKVIAPITQPGIKCLLYQLGREVLPDKKVFPYLLRHSRITSLIADEVPESVVKLQAWGSVNSRMLETYAHLSNADVDRVMLSRAGIETVETKKDESLKPHKCPHCGFVNIPTAGFCNTCGSSLTEEAAKSQAQAVSIADDAMIQNANDPKFVDAVAKRMLELQKQKK
jgi:integrase